MLSLLDPTVLYITDGLVAASLHLDPTGSGLVVASGLACSIDPRERALFQVELS